MPAGLGRQRLGGKLPPEERQTRDELILLRRLSGAKITAIQQEFQLGKSAVAEGIRRARNGRIGTLAQDMVLNRLLPRAILVMEQEMEEGGPQAVEVALKIVEATQIMSPITPAGTKVVEEFEAFRRRVVISTPAPPLEGEVFDGETINVNPGSHFLAPLNPDVPDAEPGGVVSDNAGGKDRGRLPLGGHLPGSATGGDLQGGLRGGCDLEDSTGTVHLHVPGLGHEGETSLISPPSFTPEALLLAEQRTKALYRTPKRATVKTVLPEDAVEWDAIDG